MKINAKAAGLALGILWGVALALLVPMAMYISVWTEGLNTMISFLGSLYLGYEVSLMGAIIGAIWGFVDAFIGGYLVAWLYNKFA